MSDFTFEGESHDFWEFVCVDKGEVLAAADNKTIHLKNYKNVQIMQINTIIR